MIRKSKYKEILQAVSCAFRFIILISVAAMFLSAGELLCLQSWPCMHEETGHLIKVVKLYGWYCIQFHLIECTLSQIACFEY